MSRSDAFASTSAYELLVQSVVDYAIYMLDAQGLVKSWNAGAERIKGYVAEEIIGQHFSRFYTDEERAAGTPARALKQAVETGRFAAEAWRVRKDGSRFWATVIIDPIYQDGTLIGFAKVTRDITEQREAQQAALESERRFRLLVEGVTDYAIYMLNPEGVVTNWNAGAARIKGYTSGEIVGQHFSKFYTPEDAASGLPARALAAARREGRYEAEGWRIRKDGSRFWAGVVVDAIYENGVLIGYAKITRDLTERRAAELEIEKSREQLFQSQKMEAVGHLTGGLAHDFNNLLTGITGSLELVQKRIAQGRAGEIGRYINAAQDAAARAAALTHRLLAFARRQTLMPKPTDANHLILNMRDLIDRTVGPEIEICSELSDTLWPVLCDPNQLENAILNLCINGRDAMPDGGRLTIETINTTLNEPDLPPGDYVTICITDSGTGMEPEIMTRAFDPFYTTKPAGQGTGLGLSMVYGFTTQSSGQVRLTSEIGMGTTVRLYLPRYDGAIGEEKVRSMSVAPSAQQGETILLVDDETTVRLFVADVLKDIGYTILEGADGMSGLKILESKSRIDLLITDVGLPGGINGRQMADAAKLLRPDLKVLFITGYAEKMALEKDALESGMHILNKPFSMEQLTAKISELIGEADRENQRPT